MNKSYRTVWNEATGTWAAVSEVAKARGKKSGTSKLLSTAVLVALGGATGVAHAGALDGGSVSAGGAGSNNVAYGPGAYAQSSSATMASTVIGHNATSTGNGGIAIGESSMVVGGGQTGSYSGGQPGGVAIGWSARSNGAGAMAIGMSADAEHDGTMAIGYQATANQNNAFALGYMSSATALGATSVGTNSAATGSNAVALGYNTTAATANSVALGSNSTTGSVVATPTGTVAGVSYNYAGTAPVGVVSMGSVGAEREVTNVAAGQVTATSTDAVNGSQLYATNQGVSSVTATVNNIINGGGIKYFHTNSTLADSSATGANATAIGPVATAAGGNAVAIGNGANAASLNSMALGQAASVVGSGAVALGSSSYAYSSGSTSGQSTAIGAGASAAGDFSTALGSLASTGTAATAVGVNATASGSRAISIGASSSAAGSFATVIGTLASAAGNNAAALGTAANAGATNSVAIGNSASAGTANSVALGNGAATAAAVATTSGMIGGTTYNYAGTAPTGTVSVGASGAERTITNVAAGQVTATSTDAVNGSELYATNTQVTANTNSITTLQGQVTTLQGNVTTLNGSVSTLQGNVTNMQGQLANAVMYDSSAHTSVTLGGVGATSSVALHNVAAGALNSSSTDAVNGSQLYTTNQNVASVTNTVNNITNGGGIKYFHTNSTLADSSAVGTNATAIGPAAYAYYTDDLAIGDGATASRSGTSGQSGNTAIGSGAAAQGTNSIAIGTGAATNTGSLYSGSSDIAIGKSAYSEGYDSVALGNGANVGTAGVTGYNVAVGSNSYAKATGAVALGGTATATGTNASALGAMSSAGGTSSTAVGNAANASGASTVAIGVNASASTTNSVALGNGSTTGAVVATTSGTIGGTTYGYAGGAPTGTVSVGASGAARTITNVAAGQVTATSTDAVNGSELYATNTQVTANTNSITTLQGQVTTLQGNVTTLQGDVTTINGSISTLQGNVSNINGQITNLNGQMANAVMYDSSAHTSVTLGGVGASTAVALHNVAAGALNSSSTDAVNGSQLYATNTQVTQNTSNISNLQGSVTTLQGDVTTMNGSISTLQGNVSNIDGQITNMQGQLADAVMYDSSAHTSVTLGGVGSSTAVALHNVAAGALNSSSTDAVNGSQLYATNTQVAQNTSNVSNLQGSVTTLQGDVTTMNGSISTLQGDVTNIDGQITNMQGQLADAVMYDSSAHTSVTLGGVGASTAVALHNVAAGALTESSTDAVNGSQLYATNTQVSQNTSNISTLQGDVTTINGNISTLQGDITNINGQMADAVMYDSSAHTSVTLGGVGASTAVALHNVAAGALTESSTDAVNGSQLYATNTQVTQNTTDISTLQGDITNINGAMADAVTYDSSAHNSVTLGGTSATSAVALHNVAAGVVSTSSADAVNGSQLYALANSTASSLGGGSTVNADGSITNPTYSVGGNTYNNVGSALTNLDGRVTQNTTDISTLQGDITNINGTMADAVMYDSSSHNSVTLGGVGATSAVALHNVAAGALTESSTDAVNGSQLYATNAQVSQNTTDISSLTNNINNGSVGLVQQDATTRNITVAKNTDGTLVDFTGTAGTRTLTGVTAGAVNASSADAVNGSQLYALANSTASSLGGGSTVNADGSITNPAYSVGGNTYNSVGSALTNLDGRVTQNTTDISTLQGDITNINGTMADAVMYDSSSHTSVTLGGVGATSAVALHNVAAGALTESSTDAVNGSQLYATNTQVSQNTTDISNLTNNINNGSVGLVQQDATTRNITVAKNTDGTLVDFTGTAGTRTLTGVTAGALNASSVDAVNGSQLYATNTQVTQNTTDISTLQGDITNINGTMADAVMYDSSAHDSVTLGGADATSAVTLHNVAAGAVNGSSTDAVNGSQLYNTASSAADALGGGSTVNPDGTISAPSYQIGGDTFNNVGSALTNLDGRVTQNTTDISNLTNNINNGSIGLVQQATPSGTVTVAKNSGGTTVDFTGTDGTRTLTGVTAGAVNATSTDAVNGSQLYATNQSISQIASSVTNIAGQVANAVMYDSSAQDSITLGGAGSTTAVALHNVATGTADTDAVNLGQMNAAIATVTNIANNANDPMFAANGDRDTEAAVASGTHATAAGANASASGSQSTAVGANSVASGAQSVAIGSASSATGSNSVALGAGSIANRDNTVSVGAAGSERQVTNVAAGTQGTDAVNVNQLNDAVANAASNTTQQVQQGVQQANAYTDQQIGAVRQQMNSLGAAAMAASSLVPNARASGNFQMAVAAGTYGGQTALAAGANWYVGERLLLNAHVSRSTGSGGSTGASVGATFGF